MSEYLEPNQLVKKGTVLDSSYYGVFVMLEDSGSHYAAKVRMIKPRRAEHSIDDEPKICPLVHGSGTKIISLPGQECKLCGEPYCTCDDECSRADS